MVSFRDRFFTPKVARAITSPSAILLAGAGTAVGIVTGLGVVAPVIGAAAYVVRVAAAIPRNPRAPDIDPFALPDPWRSFVRDALEAQARFGRAVKDTREGPLRERLAEIGSRIDTAVQECWRIAKRGTDIDAGRRRLEIDVKNAKFQLERINGQAGAAPLDPTVQRTVESLKAQIASDDRLRKITIDAASQLRLIDARLDESVARAVELSVGVGDLTEVGGLGSDVDDLVTNLEALRLAIEDTATASRYPTSGGSGTSGGGTGGGGSVGTTGGGTSGGGTPGGHEGPPPRRDPPS